MEIWRCTIAIRRSFNFLNQARVDVPHLRSIESAVRNDFDELISSFAIGESQSYVLRGFEINMVGAAGSSASSLQLIVENSSLFHGASDNAGTFFEVPSGTPNETLSSTTNTKVQGSFTPSATNYVGIELVRSVDNSTSAQVFLWNPTNNTEISKTVPLAETFDYNIIITSSIWASNVMPLAIIETDGSNNVSSVEDRRPMMFRLGTAGSSVPNPFHTYPWSNHSEGRDENFWRSSSSESPFRGGDKQLLHLKEWMDAMMSMVLEIKGTTYWYSENKGGSLIKLRGDLSQLQLTGSGTFYHAESTAGQLNWDSDLFLNFIGSRLRYKINQYAAGTDVVLNDNEVAYINIVRGVDITPNLVFTNGSAIVTSVGAVSWTGDVLAGDYIKVGSEDDTQYFQIQSVDSASQVTLIENFDGTSTGSGGVQAKYAYGFYEVVAVPSTDRHVQIDNRKDVPFSEDTYWLFLRQDDGTPTAKIYIRGSSGGELEQGEEREISDNTSLDILEYIGSASEVDNDPNYTDAVVTGVAEEITITFPSGAGISSGQYFTINSALDIEQYYVDAIVDAVDNDPGPAGLIRLGVNILSSDTDVQVAGKYAAALDGLGVFNATDNLDGTVTVTNSQVGATTNAANVDMPAPFAIVTDVEGVGSFNRVVTDAENLTRSIKRLDDAVGVLQDTSDVDPYEEFITVIAGAPSNDNEVTGPVVASTTVKIPRNSRNGNIQEAYTLGGADLVIFLNGNRLVVDKDYTEISSSEVEFSFQLEVDDELVFTKAEFIAGGGASGGASGANLGAASDADVFKQTVGDQLQFRRLTAGSNISITENANDIVIESSAGVANSNVVLINGVNHSLLTSEDVALVTNSGSDVTVTLPNATSADGKIYYIKKIDAGNNLFIKSVSNQTLDDVDIDATPHTITIQYEAITIVSDGNNWFII